MAGLACGVGLSTLGPMLIAWPLFAPALLLLLTPVSVFHGRRFHYRGISRHWEASWMNLPSLGLQAADLARAALGTWLLVEALSLPPGVSGGSARYLLLGVQGGVMALGALLQTVPCREPDSAYAPFAYATGLLIGFAPPLIIAFGLTMALVATIGTRIPALYFTVLPAATLGAAFLFTGKKLLLNLGLLGFAIMLPWLVSLLFSRELVLAWRRNRSRTAAAGAAKHSPLR